MATREKATGSCFYDAIVVGAGIQGTFAAYHLAKRGQKTLLLEQFPLPHTRGSSHGHSRIIRSAYPEDHYTVMMADAFRLWEELEAESGTKLCRPTPMLVLGHKESPEFQSYWRAMERNRIPSEVLPASTLAQRFPGIHLGGREMAVCDFTAGVLFADKALKAAQDQFRHHGGTIRDGEKVLGILPGAMATVTTSQEEYQAKHLVVTAGAWASHLLAPLGLQLPLQPLRITVCYWRAKGHSPHSHLEKLPCFIAISLNGDKHDVYGLPAGEYPGLVKICYHYGTPVDPDQPDQLGSSPTPDVQILRDYVSKYLPGLDPEPAVQERCLYTNTLDGDFVLDRHPRFRNIVIGAGFSGHGFKFAPVIGKILCELSLEEEPSHNVAPFRISRFPPLLKAPL
ncbi:peroxisomal sarcosine oxidase [Rhineura floridana]|uniref:peroxisomal sarcosine oxidase n=1 Tax=Rhineura floridana TaxID=261503 RepID=UPI002AC829DE|nr:peroxisomal sarcosine oxidase [Rhineura floridana]XP_061460749.1 peroxisomal sarcosine oxidase [Rhineura floridana]